MRYIEKLNVPEMEEHTVKLWEFDTVHDFAEEYNRPSLHRELQEITNETLGVRNEARKFLEEIDAAGLEVPHASFQPSVMGAYPIVPEAIAGRPDCMRRRVPAYSSASPVRIIVDPTGSQGVGSEARVRRGAVILALAILLGRERPVQAMSAITLPLHQGDGMARAGNYGAVVIGINDKPLNENTAAFVLNPHSPLITHAFAWLRARGAYTNWQFGEMPGSTPEGRLLATKHARWERLALELEPHDIYIPPAFFATKMATDPLGWVQDMLLRYRDAEAVEKIDWRC